MLQTEPELRGVMARGIAALPALLDRGYFLEPPSVREAKAAFIVASDAVRSWVDEYCTLDFDAWTARKNLYSAYRNASFANDDGSKMLSNGAF